MITLIKADSKHRDFITLVELLDRDLAIRNGEDQSFYVQFNGLDEIKHVVIAYLDQKVVGCAAMKKIEEGVFEVKRMFVTPNARGKGVATAILHELEEWANAMNQDALVLETGTVLPEAIALYAKYGFVKTENYGQYKGVETSICYRKQLKSATYES